MASCCSRPFETELPAGANTVVCVSFVEFRVSCKLLSTPLLRRPTQGMEGVCQAGVEAERNLFDDCAAPCLHEQVFQWIDALPSDCL